MMQFEYNYYSALTLLGWRHEGHLACKKTVVVGCWHGYLSSARCRLAYGPADATATHCFLLQKNADWFYLSGTSSPLNACTRTCVYYSATHWTDMTHSTY